MPSYRPLAIALSMMMLFSIDSLPSTARASTPDDATRTLLAAAAQDFARTEPDGVVVRNMRAGTVSGDDGTAHDVLCGEFARAGRADEWIAFATVRTDPFEHWIGGTATAFCQALSPPVDDRLAEALRTIMAGNGPD